MGGGGGGGCGRVSQLHAGCCCCCGCRLVPPLLLPLQVVSVQHDLKELGVHEHSKWSVISDKTHSVNAVLFVRQVCVCKCMRGRESVCLCVCV